MKHTAHLLPSALLVAALSVSVATGDDCSCEDTVCVYELMKTALYTTTTANKLHLAFFTTIPFFDSVRVSTAVNLTLTDSTLGTSTSTALSWLHQWYPYTSYGVLRKLFPAVFRGSMDPWTAIPVFYELYANQYFTPVALSISLTCTINSTTTSTQGNAASTVESTTSVVPQPSATTAHYHPIPTVTAVRMAGTNTNMNTLKTLNQLWSKTLQWAKSYARYNGPNPYPNDEDRGIAYDVMSFTPTDLLAFSLFCALYVLFNIVVAIVVIATSSMALKWLSEESQKKSYVFPLYGAAAGFSCMYAIAYLSGKIVLFGLRSRALGQIKDDVITQTFKIFEIVSVVVPGVMVFLHFINAFYIVKDVTNLTFAFKAGGGGGGGGGDIEQKVTSRKSRPFIRKAAWFLSVWFLMTEVQLLAASAIPVLVSLLTDSFRSIALFGIAGTAMVCLVIVVAIVIHTFQDGATHSKWLLFTVILLAVFGLLMTVAFAVYFLVLTNEGLDSNSISVYILSLVPTLILAGVAYFTDNYLLLDGENEKDKVDGEEDNETVDMKGKFVTEVKELGMMEMEEFKPNMPRSSGR